MRLIFVNKVGQNFKGEYIYEFLFSDVLDGLLDGNNWGKVGQATAPRDTVKSAYKLESPIELQTIQENDNFTMNDAIAGIIALAWDDGIGFVGRVVFNYGDSVDKVKEKLYKIDNFIEKYYEKAK